MRELTLREKQAIWMLKNTLTLLQLKQTTVKGYMYRFLFIFFLTACFTSVLVCITNSYYV